MWINVSGNFTLQISESFDCSVELSVFFPPSLSHSMTFNLLELNIIVVFIIFRDFRLFYFVWGRLP